MSKNHKEIKTLIAAYLDGELEEKEKKRVEAHLSQCAQCREEYEELNQLEEVLNKMQLKKPSREVWEVYWSSVYNRLERKIGWIFLSIGLIILIGMGVYPAMAGFINNPETPLLLKVGVMSLIGGGIIIFVSILREQLFCRKRERYKEVIK